MVLAKDEQVLREWEYASSKVKMVETKYSLTVTNKRIISSSKSSQKSAREEIPVSAVKGISASHEMKSKFWAILLMALGGLVILMQFFSLGEDFNAGLFFIGLLLGGFLIYLGYIRLGEGMFTLTISTKEKEGQPMQMGAIKFVKSLFNFKGKVKIKINNHAAEDIIETIGSLIVG